MNDQTMLFRLAARQFGLFTLAQARACGVSRGRLGRMLGQGVCERVHPGLFRVRAVPTSWESDALAAVLVADPLATLVLDPEEERLPKSERRKAARRKAHRKPLAVLSHSWALRAHGQDRVAPTSLPEVSVTAAHIPRFEGARAHRTAVLERIDIQWIGGLPCTSGARTVVDLAGRISETQVMALTDDMICARRTTRPHLHRRACALRGGRAGVGEVARITAADAEGTFWSWLERTFDALVRADGLPVPTYNVPLRDDRGLVGYADALWVDEKVVVELLGLRFHTRPADRQRDAAKGNRYALLGLTALWFTYTDVVEHPHEVMEQVRRALGSGA